MKRKYSIFAIMSILFLSSHAFSEEGNDTALIGKSIFNKSWLCAPKRIFIDGEFTMNQSASNFSETGKIQTPKELINYRMIKGSLGAIYGITEGVNLGGSVEYGFRTLNTTPTGYVENQITANTFGIKSVNVFSKFSIYQNAEGTVLALKPIISIPGYGNKMIYTGAAVTNNEIPLGDGAVDFTAMAMGGYNLFSNFFVNANFGYKYKSNGYSAEFPYGFDLIFFHPKIWLSAGVLGNISQKTSQYSLNVDAKTAYYVNAKSYALNSVNPEVLAVKGAGGFYAGESVGLAGFYSKTLLGKNAANEESFGVQLIYRDRFGKYIKPTNEEFKKFKTYSLQAKVVKISKNQTQVKIDKGLDDTVLQNDQFDIFSINDMAEPDKLIAKGKVLSADANTAIIQIEKILIEGTTLEENFVAKKLIPED